jgi:hypothetical protein
LLIATHLARRGFAIAQFRKVREIGAGGVACTRCAGRRRSVAVSDVLTIAKLSWRSINYYKNTANDAGKDAVADA